MKFKHQSYKKTFAILEGDTLKIIEKDTREEAVIYCQNYLDMSKEIIVREINHIQDYVTPITQILNKI